MAQPGERVYIRHPEKVWEGAVVISRHLEDGKIHLGVRTEDEGESSVLEFVSEEDLTSNVKRRNDGRNVDDLILLPHLHEPAILHVLMDRARQRPRTGVSFGTDTVGGRATLDPVGGGRRRSPRSHLHERRRHPVGGQPVSIPGPRVCRHAPSGDVGRPRFKRLKELYSDATIAEHRRGRRVVFSSSRAPSDAQHA